MLKDHSKILKDPAPFVLFQGFGDSSLDFMLYFWVDLSTTSSIKVASDMRHHILSLFRQEGVDIPYPQMDVRFPRRPGEGRGCPEAPQAQGGGERFSFIREALARRGKGARRGYGNKGRQGKDRQAVVRYVAAKAH